MKAIKLTYLTVVLILISVCKYYDVKAAYNSDCVSTGVMNSAMASAMKLKPLFASYSNTGNSGTSETDLYSYTVAASQLSNNGESLECYYGLSLSGLLTTTKNIRVYFGGTKLYDSGALTLSLTSSASTITANIVRVSSSTIRYNVFQTVNGVSIANPVAVGEVSGLTLSNTQALKITGQAGGIGAATNNIIASLGKVTWVAAP